MLIYDNSGKLVACTNDALAPFGYEDAKEFFDVYDDLSTLFIKRPGYITSYDNFSWIDFLRNEVMVKPQVLIKKDEQELALTISTTSVYSPEDENLLGISFSKKKNIADREDTAPKHGEAAFAAEEQEQLPGEEDLDNFELESDEDSSRSPLSEQEEHSGNDELLELLEQTEQTSEEETPREETPAPQEDQEQKEDQEQEDEDILDLGELDLEDDAQPEPRDSKSESDEQHRDIEDIETLDLDFKDTDKDTAPDLPQIEQPQPESEEEQEETPKQSGEAESEESLEELDLFGGGESEESRSAEQVDLDTLSKELGLEKTEAANFINDFTKMVEGKEELLYGENASTEAASLKSIAENFRLNNITKTLETIENGEKNATLLLSQIKQLKEELSPYVDEHASQAAPGGSIPWDESEKTPVEFDPNVAAESLGLPTDLISEFVNDFVEQAAENQEVFDKAYQDGDLPKIQETAHKLKGASANLRIDEIAKKLEQLQHNDDLTKVPELLKEYWGMYLGLKDVV